MNITFNNRRTNFYIFMVHKHTQTCIQVWYPTHPWKEALVATYMHCYIFNFVHYHMHTFSALFCCPPMKIISSTKHIHLCNFVFDVRNMYRQKELRRVINIFMLTHILNLFDILTHIMLLKNCNYKQNKLT